MKKFIVYAHDGDGRLLSIDDEKNVKILDGYCCIPFFDTRMDIKRGDANDNDMYNLLLQTVEDDSSWVDFDPEEDVLEFWIDTLKKWELEHKNFYEFPFSEKCPEIVDCWVVAKDL